jgi:hypothetical protein
MNPTLGRIVHYKTFDGFIFAAVIVHVSTERKTVNLAYWDATAHQLPATEVEKWIGQLAVKARGR